MFSTLLLLAACSGGSSDATPGAAPAPAALPAPRLEIGSATGGHPTTPEPDDAVLTKADCDTIEPGAPPEDGCLTGTLSCGDEIVGHTLGGANHFDTRFYEQFFCTPATTDHNGGNERIYRLEVPDGDWRVFVTMDSPCADLDLAAIKWDHPGCPDKSSRIDQCEMHRQSGPKRERLRLVSRGGSSWLIVVEGEGQHEGAYGLRVTCEPGL